MTSLGIGLAWGFGWGLGAGLVFGLSLSVASTVVLTRTLQERRILETDRGRTAVGWLVVEDLVVVLALVLLPAAAGALAGGGAPVSGWGLAAALGLTLAKVAAFVAAMLLVGRRVIPWVLHHAAHTGSRELFRFSVYAVALGVAYAASALFGVSFALGAFFAGMALAESPLSQRATEEALPLRDAFAVLFFVSVGMLFDPGVLVRSPWAVLATVAVVVVGQAAGRAADRARRLRPPAGRGAEHRGEPRADRRVLLHPRRARRGARPVAGGGPRPWSWRRRSSPSC